MGILYPQPFAPAPAYTVLVLIGYIRFPVMDRISYIGFILQDTLSPLFFSNNSFRIGLINFAQNFI